MYVIIHNDIFTLSYAAACPISDARLVPYVISASSDVPAKTSSHPSTSTVLYSVLVLMFSSEPPTVKNQPHSHLSIFTKQEHMLKHAK